MDILEYNKNAWDKEVAGGNRWTVPASPQAIAEARTGGYTLLLTPTKNTPADWLGGVRGKRILCLASGGGQQGPVFAAMGAAVTVLDNSPAQLAQDEAVAQREGLALTLEQGDMRDLSRYAENSFDLIFHPVSNCFVDDVLPVWAGCFRILKPGCALLSGFASPVRYLFDLDEWDRGNLVMRYRVPYADTEQLPPERLQRLMDAGEPLEFGHTLQSQIGGQLRAGFVLTGFYEDHYGGDLLDLYIDSFLATRAVKPL